MASNGLAVAVSGGADSLCLAVLAWRWADGCAEQGAWGSSSIMACATGPRPRPWTTARSARRHRHGKRGSCGFARVSIGTGRRLAARAREARYDVLAQACRDAGIVDLLVAHHAGDQAETALMRQRAGSGPDGMAAMAHLVETAELRLLRPLLNIAPGRLRATLRDAGVGWIEDPSNRDRAALRTRLRQEIEQAQAGLREDLQRDVAAAGAARMARQHDRARRLALHVGLRPQGYAVLPPGWSSRRVGPADPHRRRRCTRTAAARPRGACVPPRAATLGGARLLPAGRLGPGWLLVREAQAMQAPVVALDGVLWDGRFRLHAPGVALPGGAKVGATAGRGIAGPPGVRLPAVVRTAMPCLYDGRGTAIAMPAGACFAFEPRLAASQSALFDPPEGALD